MPPVSNCSMSTVPEIERTVHFAAKRAQNMVVQDVVLH
jgi:hypothetical protein